MKGRGGGAFHERHVFLFDAMIVITKPHKGTTGNSNHLYSYKSSHLIKVSVTELILRNKEKHMIIFFFAAVVGHLSFSHAMTKYKYKYK